MPKKITAQQRESILQLLAQGQDRDTIAAALGVTPGQVSAIVAHVKMGTYTLPEPPDVKPVGNSLASTSELVGRVRQLDGAKSSKSEFAPILLGVDAESEEAVLDSPDGWSGDGPR